MKKVLVTGGAGFIGSSLCENLLNQDNQVICIDDLSTGSVNNINHLFKFNNFEFIHHDIIQPIQIEADEIYNLACPASPIHYQSDPIKTVKTNVIGAMNILDLAARKKSKVLQASTSEVYGDPEVHPQVETYYGNVNPIGIRACYDEGKRCAESIFFDYHRQVNVNIRVVRIFNVYGPRMQPDDGRVISNFIVQALKGKDITIYGDGSQTRSFCYVTDLVDGIIQTMNLSDTCVGPINLGNPEEYTILELAQHIIFLTKSKSKIGYKLLPQDDPKRRKPNISYAKEIIDWEPKVKLIEGLKNTIEYFSSVI